MNCKSNKKGISPVVATALLLVVAVVAVVGFQAWFQTYQSSVNAKVELESKQGTILEIQRLEKTDKGIVYVKNSASDEVVITSWKALKDGTTYCSSDIRTNASASNVTTIEGKANCATELEVGQIYNVVVVSESGILSADLIAR